MACAGFDIGTADCVVAVPKRGTFGLGIEVLQNDIGARKTPTIVAFTEKQRLIGEEALAQVIGNAQNSITNFKRLLGRHPNDPELKHEQTFQPFKTVTHSNGRLAVEVEYENRTEQFFPEQISGAMLQKLRRIAERGLDGQKVTDCVIGVPAWWTDHQRRALLDAANIAGLNVLRLINELTAVAINYQFGRISKMDAKEREGNGKESKVMFFDMGLTATNCSIISFQGLKVNVLSTASDRTLGGRDFDQLLVEHLLGVIRTKYKMDPATNRKAMLKLNKECTRIKQVLSANVKVPYNLEYFMNDKDVSGMVERAEFEAMAGKTLIPRLYPIIQEALKQAGCTVDQLEAIEVIGGGVRIPIVQKSLEEFLKRPLSKTCDGDESIARGAAWQAALLSPRYTIGIAPQVKDIYPYPISVVWQELDKGSTKPMSDSKMDDPQALFVGNSAVPNTKIMSFYRTEPFQLTAFYPDLSNMPPGTEKLVGKFVVSNAPALYKPEKPTDKVSQPTVKVRLRLDFNGVVSCTAAEMVEEVETDAPVEPKKEEAKKEEAPKTEAPKGEEPKKDGAMDTTDDKGKKTEETAAAGATKRVKKTIRNDLKVETFGTGSLDPATFQSCFEREAQMANADRIVAETALMRNSLEAYVLEMRNKIQGELKEYIKQSEAETFLGKLDQMEQWLYDEGQDTQKSEYKKRLDDLKSVGDAAVGRRREREGREPFVVALKSAVGRFSAFAQSTDEKYSHIEADERKKVLSECSAADQWLASSLSKQDKLSPADNPVITCEQIRQKTKDLENFVQPIMSKPKPQPKKEEPKKEEAPKTEAPKAEAPQTEQPKAADPKAKMDTSS